MTNEYIIFFNNQYKSADKNINDRMEQRQKNDFNTNSTGAGARVKGSEAPFTPP